MVSLIELKYTAPEKVLYIKEWILKGVLENSFQFKMGFYQHIKTSRKNLAGYTSSISPLLTPNVKGMIKSVLNTFNHRNNIVEYEFFRSPRKLID